MSNDNNYLFILDRINFPEKILLDRTGYTYTCGKSNENDIVCRSTRVSNRHCTFFHNKNELYVTDLKSIHGISINGVLQQPFQTIKLHLNDIIGIGCSATEDLIINNNIYAYKLRAFRSLCQEDGERVGIPSATISSNNKETANMTVANNVHKDKRECSNSDLKLLRKIPRFQDQKCALRRNYFSKKLNIMQGKDKEKSETRDKLNTEKRTTMNMPTCSKNWPDNSARFSKSKESEKLQLSDEEKTERQGKLKSQQHLHAREQKNRQVPRKWTDSNTTLLNILSTEELQTLENNIKMKLKKIEEEEAASLANNRGEKHKFPKPEVNITTKSEYDIRLGQMIAGSEKEIITEEPIASSSQFVAADNTSSNEKATNRIKSKNVFKDMATGMDSYHELYNKLLFLKRLNNL